MTLLFGVTAGVMGTAAMSALLLAGRMTGLLGPPPPRRIARRVAERSGVDQALSGPGFEAAWVAAHFGYGAVCGALYAVARPALPESPLAAGLVFGGAVWGGSYLGLMPALGIYGGPAEESPSTTGVMITAHAVYGTVTALAEARIRESDHLFA